MESAPRPGRNRGAFCVRRAKKKSIKFAAPRFFLLSLPPPPLPHCLKSRNFLDTTRFASSNAPLPTRRDFTCFLSALQTLEPIFAVSPDVGAMFSKKLQTLEAIFGRARELPVQRGGRPTGSAAGAAGARARRERAWTSRRGPRPLRGTCPRRWHAWRASRWRHGGRPAGRRREGARSKGVGDTKKAAPVRARRLPGWRGT